MQSASPWAARVSSPQLSGGTNLHLCHCPTLLFASWSEIKPFLISYPLPHPLPVAAACPYSSLWTRDAHPGTDAALSAWPSWGYTRIALSHLPSGSSFSGLWISCSALCCLHSILAHLSHSILAHLSHSILASLLAHLGFCTIPALTSRDASVALQEAQATPRPVLCSHTSMPYILVTQALFWPGALTVTPQKTQASAALISYWHSTFSHCWGGGITGSGQCMRRGFSDRFLSIPVADSDRGSLPSDGSS